MAQIPPELERRPVLIGFRLAAGAATSALQRSPLTRRHYDDVSTQGLEDSMNGNLEKK